MPEGLRPRFREGVVEVCPRQNKPSRSDALLHLQLRQLDSLGKTVVNVVAQDYAAHGCFPIVIAA